MKVEIKYFGNLRGKVGRKSEIREVEDTSSLGAFLKKITRTRGIHTEVFGEPIRGKKPNIMILINGRNVRFLQKMDTLLKEGDTVSLFPPIGGG